jgi:hypothetical protein
VTGLVGRPLAVAAHPICRAADPGQSGLSIGEFEAAVLASGIEINGKDRRQVLGTAINGAQDLYEWIPSGRWRWIERVPSKGAGLSSVALAEEAYMLAIRHDPDRQGLHYEALKRHLLDSGVIIRGANPGKTLFSALQRADKWFDWSPGGIFTWK